MTETASRLDIPRLVLGSLLFVLAVWWALPAARAEFRAQARIVGGSEALPGGWPWMVALVTRGEDITSGQFCGGTLISAQWILTAAHCVLDEFSEPGQAVSLDALIGTHDFSAAEGERVSVSEIVAHPGYDVATFDSDIALLKLARPVIHTPIDLPGQTYDAFAVAEETMATAIGWGSTSVFGLLFPRSLQQVELPIAKQQSCDDVWESRSGVGITNNMVCTGVVAGRDTCVGDSGGPLMIPTMKPTGWEQVGITSFGAARCAQPGSYAVYTRVSRYAQWISSIVCSDSETPPAPVLVVTVAGNTVTAATSRVDSATGYRLYYAPAPALQPIGFIDLGPQTKLAARLPDGSSFFLAVQPYNDNCLGEISNMETFTIP